MTESIPEFLDRGDLESELRSAYPMTIVMDSFAVFVGDRVRDGASEHELRPYFEFVEHLAESDDRDVRNLVIVDFIEMEPWGLLGARELLGPATRALARSANPNMIDTTML